MGGLELSKVTEEKPEMTVPVLVLMRDFEQRWRGNCPPVVNKFCLCPDYSNRLAVPLERS